MKLLKDKILNSLVVTLNENGPTTNEFKLNLTHIDTGTTLDKISVEDLSEFTERYNLFDIFIEKGITGYDGPTGASGEYIWIPVDGVDYSLIDEVTTLYNLPEGQYDYTFTDNGYILETGQLLLIYKNPDDIVYK